MNDKLISMPVAMLNLPSSQVEHNLIALNNRRKGEKFFVNNKGLLQKLTGMKKFFYRTNGNYRAKVQKNVQRAVAFTIRNLDPNICRTTDKNINKIFFEHFFFDRLSNLSTRVFDRRMMGRLDPNILQLIAPEFLEARSQAQPDKLEINEESLTTNNDYFEYAVAAADFAMKLGIAPKAVKEGASGTYFLRDLSGKNIGVFKPKDEETLAPQSPKPTSQISRIAVKILPLATAAFCSSGNAYKAEAAASIVSQQLGLNNVPTTRVVSLAHPVFNYSKVARNETVLPSKEGSFQLFIQTPHTRADKYLKYGIAWKIYKLFRLEHKKLEKKIDQSEFEKLVILDFVIGNIDRHFANWIVTLKKKILCFDNGFAMANKHTDSVSSIHQYEWRLLLNAKKPFSDEAKRYIDKLSNEQEELIQALRSQNLINVEQEQALRDRIAVLIKFANEGKTMRELSKVITTKQFQAVLGKDQRSL